MKDILFDWFEIQKKRGNVTNIRKNILKNDQQREIEPTRFYKN